MTSPFPGFYIIGAPKCGTSSIYDWLGRHPEILAPHKEPCFFSQDIYPTTNLPSHIRSTEEYCRIFRLGPGKRISGEATPKYLYSDLALAQISQVRPDAKIIVCLRNPVDLAISLHNQKLVEGVEKELNFEKAWLSSLRTSVRDQAKLSHERNYYRWACIGTRLQMLDQYFPRSAIHIVTTSELMKDPRSCYLGLLRFLGVDDDGQEAFVAKNERVRVRSAQLNRALLATKATMQPLLHAVSRLRGGRGTGALRLVGKFNVEPGAYTTKVSPDFREQMHQELAEEVRLAESFLEGRRLALREQG